MPNELEVLRQKLATRQTQSLAKTIDSIRKAQGTALLLDRSSSMETRTRSGKTRFQILRDAVLNFPKVRKFQFASTCEEIAFGKECEEPCGSTALHYALETVKSHDVTHVILVTDGEPDSEHLALHCATGLRIDIIYCGDEPIPAFLKDLADASNGTFSVELMESQASLETKIRGLLSVEVTT